MLYDVQITKFDNDEIVVLCHFGRLGMFDEFILRDRVTDSSFQLVSWDLCHVVCATAIEKGSRN